MNDKLPLNRRNFLAIGGGLVLCADFVIADEVAKKPIAKVAPLVRPKAKWDAANLREFLEALPAESMLSLMKGLGMVSEQAGLGVLKGSRADAQEVQKQALWISSSIFTYHFRNERALNYHDLVAWVASSVGVNKNSIKRESSFFLERKIMKQIFSDLWDKLTRQQRVELLDKIETNAQIKLKDRNGKILDKAAVAALGGAGALSTLSLTVAFSGFAFYTTLSVTLSAVAGFFGVTLPFAAYAGASSLVAFLSGPVGWAIIGLAALGGVALAGRADMKKTTAFVCQIHALKIMALTEAGVSEKDIFGQHATVGRQ